MKIEKTCFACIMQQVYNLCENKHIHATQIFDKNTLLTEIRTFLQTLESKTLHCPPPKIATHIYDIVSKTLGSADPFLHIKTHSNTKAKFLRDNLLINYPKPTDSELLLEWAVKIALLGNVIDYGSQSNFDFESTHFDMQSIRFGEYALSALQSNLAHAKHLLYLADNAGEHYFDEVLIKTLKELYPYLNITYAVRGKAIINDLTIADIKRDTKSNLQSYCKLLDTGIKSPGFIYEECNLQTKEIFDKADIILAKGMGNFECLESKKDSRLFMLFKIKCDVVAHYCSQPKGVMMLRHNID